jgi:creatinine amidohydrolase/Fe(II)-dependent formamide hydrolase-like protein
MYATEEVFALVVREQLRLAVQMGFRLIVVITGHAAENQISVLDRLAAEFSAAGPAKVLVALPFTEDAEGMMAVGHASKVETSVMLALNPESVDLNALPSSPEPLKNIDWAVVDYQTFSGNPTPDRAVHTEDDPRLATAENGRQTIEQAVDKIVAQVNSARVVLDKQKVLTQGSQSINKGHQGK